MKRYQYVLLSFAGLFGTMVAMGIVVLGDHDVVWARGGTPTPTVTPDLTPTSDLIQLAQTSVAHNDDWTPVVREFGGVEMVLVPVGCFVMGSTEEEQEATFQQCEHQRGEGSCERSWFQAEGPVHRVCFEKPYWIGRFEVTNAQYEVCVAAEACDSLSGDFPAVFYEANYPVVGVSWFQAQQYTQWLSATTGAVIQLPTEAQWEYAARGPDGLIYPWGNEFVAENVVYNDAGIPLEPVGSKPDGVSWVGALDISGNVWEWVADWYGGDYYATLPDDVVNPLGPTEGVMRGLRGGAFDNGLNLARCAVRNGYYPDFENGLYGFRIVYTASVADGSSGR